MGYDFTAYQKNEIGYVHRSMSHGRKFYQVLGIEDNYQPISGSGEEISFNAVDLEAAISKFPTVFSTPDEREDNEDILNFLKLCLQSAQQSKNSVLIGFW